MIVIYHANCADGFAAAWMLSKVFPDATFVPANYGERRPDVTGQDVIVADFSYPRDVMESLIKDSKSVVVLDHHASAQKELAGLSDPKAEIVFDLEKSGARLTWDWIRRLPGYGEEGISGSDGSYWPVKFLVDYTEDRDLWRWRLPHSKAINAAIRSYPMTFETWNDISHRHLPIALANEGEAILRYQDKVVAEHASHAAPRDIGGYLVPTLNATTLVSEIGHVLAQGQPFAATYFDRPGQRIWSLRSTDEGEDVSVIAKRLGGGGHRNAAGFTETL